MENQVQAMDDKQAEVGKEKQPYATPKLLKLGSVKELTEGLTIEPIIDDGTISF